MAATSHTTATTHDADIATTGTDHRDRLAVPGLLAAVVAAAATTTVAGIALAAGVPLSVEGEQIPLLAFPQLTLFFSLIGLGLAAALRRWARSPRRTFTVTTMALTVLSIVPDLSISASPASKAVLLATHLVAAAIVIPTVAGRLPERTR
jgi:hypothetical protein